MTTKLEGKTFGLVLAGGRSSRMGQDKFLIKYHGKPQYLHLYDLLQHCCDKVFVSCNESQVEYIDESVPIIVDKTNFEGPLSAIKQAFMEHTVNWLTAPCDMPNIHAQLLKRLVKMNSSSHIHCTLDSENRLNPLLAYYKMSNKDFLHQFNGKSVTDYIKSVGYDALPLKEDEGLNVNTKVAYENYIRNRG